MSREFSEQHVRALCLLTGIEVLKVWQQDNQYWPIAYAEERQRSPWFLVKTRAGMVQIGWRKNVLSIDWDDTPIQASVTQDDVTKSPTMVHAWSYPKAIEYLQKLSAEIAKHVATVGVTAAPETPQQQREIEAARERLDAVPPHLRATLPSAPGVAPSPTLIPTDEQIVAAFLAKRPDWRQSGDWLVIGSAAPREPGDAIHTSDVIDAARAALALGVDSVDRRKG